MTAQDPATRTSRNSFLTIAQLVISLGGAFVSILAAAFLLIADRFTQTQPGIDRTGLGQINQLVVMLLLLAFAGIPSIVLCIRWLRGIEPGEAKSNRWLLVASFLLIVWLGALYAGALLLNNGQSSPFLLVVDLFLIALPLIWLLGLALHRIKAGSWKRFWGLVAGTFYITLPIILIVEGIILITAILAASALPGFQDFFNQLSALATSSTESLDQMLNELAPVLASPQAMYTLIFGFGLLIPLVEEFLKPLMLWLFSRRHLTPSQGFAIGVDQRSCLCPGGKPVRSQCRRRNGLLCHSTWENRNRLVAHIHHRDDGLGACLHLARWTRTAPGIDLQRRRYPARHMEFICHRDGIWESAVSAARHRFRPGRSCPLDIRPDGGVDVDHPVRDESQACPGGSAHSAYPGVNVHPRSKPGTFLLEKCSINVLALLKYNLKFTGGSIKFKLPDLMNLSRIFAYFWIMLNTRSEYESELNESQRSS
jgi:hypothetical protein